MLRDTAGDGGPLLAVLAVADGMGGHHAGADASRLAVQTAGELLSADDPVSAQSIRNAFERADRRIRDFAANLPDGKVTGATLTVAVVVAGQAIVGHVGDSRAWLHDGEALQQVTVDHSLVARLVRAGLLAEPEAMRHPDANVLDRALGAGHRADPNLYRVGVGPGDILLLSTDGLHATLTGQQIGDILSSQRSHQAACDALITAARHAGSTDNITVVAWQYPHRSPRTTTVDRPPAASDRRHRNASRYAPLRRSPVPGATAPTRRHRRPA